MNEINFFLPFLAFVQCFLFVCLFAVAEAGTGYLLLTGFELPVLCPSSIDPGFQASTTIIRVSLKVGFSPCKN